jgi:transcriptional regulator with XRE-family HTH domain
VRLKRLKRKGLISMGKRPRPKPKKLPAKLFAIRQRLDLSQSQLVRALNCKLSSARISEYEHGIREPDLITLLKYSMLARVSINMLVDDETDGLELLREPAAKRQRLHDAAVQVTVVIAALDKIVSSLLDVGEALKAILDEPDDCSSRVS